MTPSDSEDRVDRRLKKCAMMMTRQRNDGRYFLAKKSPAQLHSQTVYITVSRSHYERQIPGKNSQVFVVVISINVIIYRLTAHVRVKCDISLTLLYVINTSKINTRDKTPSLILGDAHSFATPSYAAACATTASPLKSCPW